MATIQDPAFRFATNVFDTDGTDKVYDISFALGYIEGDNVVAMSGVEDPDTKLLTDIKSHVVSFIDVPPGNRVKVSPVPAGARKLVLFRQTDISKLLVKFEDGKLQTGRNLDLSSTQLIMAIQEIVDGLRQNNLIVEQQVGTIVDLNKIITEIYKQVLELLESGGIVSVAPRVWTGKYDPDNPDATDFEIPGADVVDAGFYDTYINGVGLLPDGEFSILLADPNIPDSVATIRFAEPLKPGWEFFTVLRGFAKPYTGPAPVTSLAYPIVRSDSTIYFLDKKDAYAVVLLSGTGSVTATLKTNPVAGPQRIETGTFLTLVQRGGQISLTADPGVNIIIPGGCVAKTRAANSAISLTCLNADANEWLLSGDLAKE